MKNIFRIINFVLLFLIVVLTQAQERKVGLNSMAFLNVGVGARNVALGSAATSINNDVNQVFWNPAGSALRDEMLQVSFNYDKWIGDLNHNTAAIGYNLKDVGTFTLGVNLFGASDIESDRDNFPDDPVLSKIQIDNNSGSYNYLDMAISLTYARYLLDNLSLGISVKYLNENIDGMNASAIAVDLGSNYTIGSVLQNDGFGIYDWRISAKLTNLGSDIKFYDFASSIPLSFAIGTSFMPIQTDVVKLMLAVDVVKPQDGPQYFFSGGEVTLMDVIQLRGGYKIGYSGTKDDATKWKPSDENTLEGASFGAGFFVPLDGYKVKIDYSYTTMTYYDAVHRISLSFGYK